MSPDLPALKLHRSEEYVPSVPLWTWCLMSRQLGTPNLCLEPPERSAPVPGAASRDLCAAAVCSLGSFAIKPWPFVKPFQRMGN